jgi:hypothetical protein
MIAVSMFGLRKMLYEGSKHCEARYGGLVVWVGEVSFVGRPIRVRA